MSEQTSQKTSEQTSEDRTSDVHGPRRGYLGAAWVAGLGVGLVIACLDAILAWLRHSGALGLGRALEGMAVVALVDVSLCLAVALLASLVAACMYRFDALGQRGRALGRVVSAVVRGQEREHDARRVAAVSAGLVGLLAGGLGVMRIASDAVPRVRGDWLVAVPTGLWCAAWLAVVGLLSWLAARVLERGLRGLPDWLSRWLTTRALLAVVAAGALLAFLVWGRAPFVAFTRAVDIWPGLLLALAGALASLAILVVSAMPRARVVALALRVNRPRVWQAILAAGLVAWLVVPVYLGQSGSALHLQRKSAPLASRVIPLLARVLDFDGDGYSHYFGDGDCAPWDGERSPGAREIVGNGVDEDCFDGDLESLVAMRPPAPHPVPASVPRDLSFVIILVDALRPDHLGAFGYQRATSPNIDRLAASAVVFERAYAASSYTSTSVGSLLVSQVPSHLPAKMRVKKGGLPADARTLGRLLAEAGLETAMVTDYGATATLGNFSLGFDRQHRFADRAEKVTAAALAELEEFGASRFLLWVDYVGPHNPYRNHKGIPRFGDEFMDVYDHEIAYTDHHLGALLRRIDQPDLRDRVVVVLVADHGEAFGEHGSYYHGHNLHEENVRVPFMIRVPGVAPRRLSKEPVSLLDVLPTVLNLGRIPVPDDLVGHDLTGSIVTGEEPPGRSVFMEAWFSGYGVSEASYHAAVATARYKLIEESDTRSIRLYDLVDDPGETRDLAHEERAVLVRLRRLQKRYQSLGHDP